MLLIGGGAKGEVWQQILADIWQKPLMIPEYLEEATSIGARYAQVLALGPILPLVQRRILTEW